MSRWVPSLFVFALGCLTAPAAPTIVPVAPANNAANIGATTSVETSVSNSTGTSTVTFFGRQTAPAAPGPDFVVGTLPDTQYYSENSGGNRAQIFHAQTQYYLDNRAALNLAFVSHMGDFVQNGDGVPGEWLVADGAMARIEHRVNSLTAFGIPWGGAPGNHDTSPVGNPTGTSTYFNQYFGAARFSDRSFYRGHYGTTNNNNHQFFSASGLDFIVIHLTYRTAALTTGEQEVLDWADALLKAYPNRRAIVTSHWVIGTSNSFEGPGQRIYDNLKDNPNLFLLLCGHIHGEGRRSDVFAGRTVHAVLQDYQSRPNGGNGWLRYFIFSPANNTISARTYSPTLDQFETDADSQFTLAYDMQGAITDWIPLGNVNVAAGAASLPWTGLEPDSHYEWYATATDSTGSSSTSPRRFSTVAAQAPVVALNLPANGASFAATAGIMLSATATDADGTVAKVEFYQGGTKLGESVTGPSYGFVWNNAAVGEHVLSVVAIDDTGRGTLSNLVNITVTPPPVSGPVLLVQDFNAMGASGTTPPAGWSMKNLAGSGGTWTGTTIPGTGSNSVASMVNTSGTLTAANAPTTANVNGYNAGATGNPADRLLGTGPTSNTGNAIQLSLTNTVGVALTHLAVAYEIHRFNASSGTNELPGYQLFHSLDNGATWTNVAALNPTTGGPTGVVVANSAGITVVAPHVFALSGAWNSGATLLLRWVDDNANGFTDQVIGLDDVTITAAGLPPLAVWKFSHFANAGADSNGDTDGDGMTELLEYALGGDPDLPDPAILPDASLVQAEGGEYLALTFVRDPTRTDIRYIVEVSADLVTWVEIASADYGAATTPIAPATAAHITGDANTAGIKNVTVRDTSPLAGTPRRFIRLRVVE